MQRRIQPQPVNARATTDRPMVALRLPQNTQISADRAKTMLRNRPAIAPEVKRRDWNE